MKFSQPRTFQYIFFKNHQTYEAIVATQIRAHITGLNAVQTSQHWLLEDNEDDQEEEDSKTGGTQTHQE